MLREIFTAACFVFAYQNSRESLKRGNIVHFPENYYNF